MIRVCVDDALLVREPGNVSITFAGVEPTERTVAFVREIDGDQIILEVPGRLRGGGRIYRQMSRRQLGEILIERLAV